MLKSGCGKQNHSHKEGLLGDIRVLQYFLAVTREESITKATDTLRMTQPPLFRQLKDLEQELGKQLFIRGSKKVMLTEDGMLFLKRAEELVDFGLFAGDTDMAKLVVNRLNIIEVENIKVRRQK